MPYVKIKIQDIVHIDVQWWKDILYDYWLNETNPMNLNVYYVHLL